jgi:peptide-methionine (S)-S-oxide reductase
VGYTGGDVPNATYRNHGTHAEGIEIIFDPEMISYRRILEYFFQIHDPTTRNRQGNDVGSSYRSAIYYVDDEQKRIAEDTIADVDASGLWPGKAVTEVEPVGDFWQAEPEHQDYLERYPNGYTCHYPRAGSRQRSTRLLTAPCSGIAPPCARAGSASSAGCSAPSAPRSSASCGSGSAPSSSARSDPAALAASRPPRSPRYRAGQEARLVPRGAPDARRVVRPLPLAGP